MINTFDIDGVIYMGEFDGVYPSKNDIIITGRSYQEKHETMLMLAQKGIANPVYFNPLEFSKKTRQSSGHHKANILNQFIENGTRIGIHFEDDPIQAQIIQSKVSSVKVVLLQHDLVEKENVRHTNIFSK